MVVVVLVVVVDGVPVLIVVVVILLAVVATSATSLVPIKHHAKHSVNTNSKPCKSGMKSDGFSIFVVADLASARAVSCANLEAVMIVWRSVT